MQRQKSSVLLDRFVGLKSPVISGADSAGFLDVLGIEKPGIWKQRVNSKDQSVPASCLEAQGGSETYVARVEAIDGVPRGVVSGGREPLGLFPLRSSSSTCPQGWARSPTCDPPVPR